MDIRVNTQEVQNAVNNIDAKKAQMLEIYRTKILPTLQSSEDYLKVSGLSYDEIVASFNQLFGSLDNQLGDFTSTVNNKVIPKYQASANIVSQMFNSEFADQMQDIISQMNSE